MLGNGYIIKRMKNLTKFKRSACALANLLDILGDKWTLLVIRDLYFGKKTYGEFHSSAEKIPTNILAERLKRLEFTGIIYKKSYQQHPIRYHYYLTGKGEALAPVLKEMVIWGNKFIPDTVSLATIEQLLSKKK